jgi:hypothetical protein
VKLLFKIFIALAFIALFITSAYSQKTFKRENPILPSEERKTEIGFFIGLGGNNQSGIFRTQGCQCDFINGTGFGLTIGGLYETEIIPRLRWGGALEYDLRSFTSSFREREPDTLRSQTTGAIEIVPVWFRYQVKSAISYLSIIPYLKYVPADFLFFRIGLSGSFVIGAGITQTKAALDETVPLSTGEIAKVTLPNGGLIYNGKFPSVNTFQYSLEPAIGLTFPFGKKLNFSPVFQYSIPLNNFTSSGDNVKISAWRILLEFRFVLKSEENS